MVHDVGKRYVGQDGLGGDALALRPCGDLGEAVAGFLFIGLGEDFAQVIVRERPISGQLFVGRCGGQSYHGDTLMRSRSSASSSNDGLV